MLQTMLVADVIASQNKDEVHHWDNCPYTSAWREIKSQKTDSTINRTIKKKSKRSRTAFTTDQIRALEETFLINKYISSDNRRELSKKLKINEKCIKIWFQNRRMKEKKSLEFSDASSEVFSREVMSPPLVSSDSDNLQRETEPYQYGISPSNQCTNIEQYYQPLFDTYNFVNHDQAQVIATVQQHSVFARNDFGYDMSYYSENSPYSTQYYPCTETEVNTHIYQNQNQYQVSDNWWTNNMDFSNLH